MVRQLVPVARALRRNLPADAWKPVPDPRNPQGVRYALATLLQVLLVGLMTHQRTLRDVERLMKNLAARAALGIRGVPSDTTIYSVLGRLNPDSFRAVVVNQVRGMARSKQLENAIDFPLSIVAIDGKALGTDEEKLHPDSHATETKGGVRYTLKALRVVHVSSAVKPVLDQRIIPDGKGERHNLWPLLQWLRRTYGALVQCFSFDAGFWSQDLVTGMAICQMPFILALKGNAGAPYRCARRALGKEAQDPACGWQAEDVEKQGKKVVRRQIARVDHDLGTYGGVKGAWRQRTTIFIDGVQTSQDDRYFATSFDTADVTAVQALAAIRAHWGIENDSNWTMDAILDEDTHTWAKKGQAREVLCWLRILAYNLLRLFRCRALRAADRRAAPWRQIIEEIRDALVIPDVWRRAFS